MGFFRNSLHLKIISVLVCIIAGGVALSIYWELKNKESELLDEKLRASRFMAQPVINALYEDMIEERADMARHLVETLGKTEGVEFKIIRSNGVEQAFMDMKTIEAVKKEFGEVRPEWLTHHPDVKVNIAKGTEAKEFKKALEDFKADWGRGAVHYVDKSGPSPVLTYLVPIEKKSKCKACHVAEGARGIVMISTSLDGMYARLATARNQWTLLGAMAILSGTFLLSMVIRRSVTGPIKGMASVIKDITGRQGAIRERVKVDTGDELGYLASAFNSMLDTLEKRYEENIKLIELVTKSKEEWVATFDAIQDLISIHDVDMRVIKVNKALAAKLGRRPEELLGMRCSELFRGKESPAANCPHAITTATGRVVGCEADDFIFDGMYSVTTFPILDKDGRVTASVHVLRDVTQEKLLREQLLHAEKLSSVGKLVAGIAHELNNPLMGIMGFSQILMDSPGTKTVEDIRPKLQRIYHESLRTAKIVQNLLTFSRSKKIERGLHNINEVLSQTVDLREYSLKTNNIEVVTNFDLELPRTMLDLFQLQQVFINIINNAEDAMVAQKKGGRLDIGTSMHRGRIRIVFKDDGPGIPKQVIHKVFDPFFTTKEVGKGTGLGLSISHGIITEHGGTIELANHEGGAMVTIELPVVDMAQWTKVKIAIEGATSVPIVVDKPGPVVIPGRKRRVLIVDDEQSIRESLKEILERDGFFVDVALEGEDALKKLEASGFEAVLMDINMPGIGGKDLHNAIVERYPSLIGKVIVLTGDVFSKDVKDFLTRTNCPYLLKPFELKDLRDLIKRVLG